MSTNGGPRRRCEVNGWLYIVGGNTIVGVGGSWASAHSVHSRVLRPGHEYDTDLDRTNGHGTVELRWVAI